MEVDNRDQLPQVHQQEAEGYKYPSNPTDLSDSNRALSDKHEENQAGRPGRSICGLRATTFILGLALAVVTVLAIVAAAVGGSLAEKRKNTATPTPQPASSSSPTAPAQNTTSLPTTLLSNATNIIPSTDCTTLGTSYTSTQDAHQKYTITCEANIGGTDYNLIAVFVYYFEDCIEACSNYNSIDNNSTCNAAIYVLAYSKQEQQGLGNCFLKDLPQGQTAEGFQGAYLAMLVQS